MINEKIGFVIGNGESRKNYNIQKLIDDGYPVNACNAAYRDFTPTTLIACDDQMIKEIFDTGYNSHMVYRKRKLGKLYEYKDNKHVELTVDRGHAAGAIAIYIMLQRKEIQLIFLLGYDIYGNEGQMNNIYKGTRNYKDENSEETYGGNFISQLGTLATEYPGHMFYRVGREKDPYPEDWQRFNIYNIFFISYEEMKKIIDSTTAK